MGWFPQGNEKGGWQPLLMEMSLYMIQLHCLCAMCKYQIQDFPPSMICEQGREPCVQKLMLEAWLVASEALREGMGLGLRGVSPWLCDLGQIFSSC